MSYLDDFCEKSKSEIVKAIVEGLTLREKQAFTQAVRKITDDNAAEATISAANLARELSTLQSDNRRLEVWLRESNQETMRYKGFYDAVVEPELIKWGGRNNKTLSDGELSVEQTYLDGVAEAVQYLLTKPDQIIQHLQDPNPKVKDVNINYRNRNRKDSEL